MGALYHLKQRLVDFCNVIQQNVNRTDTVPSSAVVYGLKSDTNTQISELNDSVNAVSIIKQYSGTNFSELDDIRGDIIMADLAFTQDGPTADNRWFVVSFLNGSGYYGFQMTLGFGNAMYVRNKRGTETWSEWKKVTLAT